MVFISATVILVLSLLPGVLILARIPAGPLHGRHLVIPASFALSFFMITVLSLAVFLCGLPPLWGGLFLYAAAIGILWWTVRLGRVSLPPLPWDLLRCYLLYVAYLLLLLFLTPTYETGGTSDWGLYYPNSLLFLGRQPVQAFADGLRLEYLVKRTPLLSLYCSFFMGFCGRGYAFFQVASLVANSMIFWLVLALGDRFLPEKGARMGMLMLLFAPGLVRAVIVPEPKMIGTVFALFALFLHSAPDAGRDTARRASETDAGSRCRSMASGVSGVAAVMCHPSMLFYVVWIYACDLYAACSRRGANRGFWAGTAGALLVLVVPWFAWVTAVYGIRALGTPTATLSSPLPMGPLSYLGTRLGMILSTILVPLPLAEATIGGKLFSNTGSGGLLRWFATSGDLLARYYQQTFLGGMGTLVGGLLLIRVLPRATRLREMTDMRTPLLWLLAGALLCFGVHVGVTDYKGHALNLTAPLFVPAFLAAAATVSGLSPGWRRLICLSAILEFAFVRLAVLIISQTRETHGLAYVAGYAMDWLRGPGLLPVGMVMAIVVTAYVQAVRGMFPDDPEEERARGRA